MEKVHEIFDRIKKTQRNKSPDNLVCLVDHTAGDGCLYRAIIEKIPPGEYVVDSRFMMPVVG